MGDLWVAVILGIVEGLTEFIPVSSTGHLIVVGKMLGFYGEKAACFEVFIQLGAILAVVMLYWRRFVALIPTNLNFRSEFSGFSGFRGIFLLALTTFPALVLGALTHSYIKHYLFGPITVALALALGGLGILAAEKYKPEAKVRSLDDIDWKIALSVGLFQCLSLWPGVSRAGGTIIGGLLSGMDRKSATEYSFLAAVPVMIAAVSYDLYKSWSLLKWDDISFFAVGFVVSFISAALAIKTFIAAVQRWSLAPYAWYRLAIAPIIYFWLN